MDLSTLPMSAALASRPPRISGSDIGTARRPGVLALDLGTTTGWALRFGDGGTISGTMTFKPGRFEGGGMRFLRFTDWLVEIAMHAHGLRRVVFEEVRRHAGTDASHVYGGFLGTLTAWCEEHELPYQGVPVGTIKRYATGKGNASRRRTTTKLTRWPCCSGRRTQREAEHEPTRRSNARAEPAHAPAQHNQRR